LAKHIKEDTLVVIESTINPGVCDDVVIPLLEKTSGLKGGKNVFVAHCPERINPGDTKWNVENISRVVGADSTEGLERALSFYRDILTGEVKPMGSIKEAEAVKVVENSFRDINIAFVNELAMSFQKMGINIENVIDGAATKPFAFMPHHPGCGVGGHCIPVDPYYLIEHARGFGFEHRFLQLAREINEGMPDYTIDLVKKGTEKAGIEKADCQIVVMGQSYKPDVDDARESPAVKILSKLKALGFQAKAYDPHIPGKSDFDSLEDALSYANTLLIATAHSEFKALSPDVLSKNDIHVLIDGRNMFRTNYQEFKHTIYLGIGINA
jgi:nucleotide sugar dehydrogenase